MTAARRVDVRPPQIAALVLSIFLGVGLVGIGAATADPLFSFSGKVYLGSTATPATTGQLMVEYTANDADHRPQDSVPVAADGSYQITGLASGAYSIYFHYLGTGPYSSTYYGQAAAVTDTQWAQTTVYNDVVANPEVLQMNGAITGHVAVGTSASSAKSGEVAVSYRVDTGGSYSSESAPVYTDASGNYSIPNLPQSDHYRLHFVDASTPSVQSGWWSNGVPVNSGGALVVGAGGATIQATADILLPPVATLAGHVFFGSSSTHAGAGIVALTLLEYPDQSNPAASAPVAGATATTDANGGYSIGGLTNGNYTLVATSRDPHTDASASLNLTVNGATTGADITLSSPRYVVTGHVDDRSGHSAAAGEITVALTDILGSVLLTTETDSAGNFRFEHFAGGRGYVSYTFTDPPIGRSSATDDQTFNITSDTVVADWVMATSLARSSLSGHVSATGGTPLSGIAMTAAEYNADSGAFVATFTTTTDAQGGYTFLNLPIDEYGIQARDPAQHYATMEYNNESPYYQPDYLQSVGGSNDGLDFTMPAAGHIQGKVTGPSPAELASGDFTAEVEVQDYSSGSPVWFETGDLWPVNADGSYDIGDLPPDDYRVRFSDPADPSFPPVTTPTVHVAEGQTVPHIDAAMSKSKPQHDLDFTGDGLPDVLVTTAGGALYEYAGSGSSGWKGSALIGSGWNYMNAVVAAPGFAGAGVGAPVIARDGAGNLWLYRGDHNLWQPPVKIGVGWSPFTTIFSPGDFDGDGNSDVMAVDGSGDLWLYRGNGAGGFVGGAMRVGTGWNGFSRVMSVGDFDGDGHVDVMAMTPSGALYLYRGNGSGGWLGGAAVGSGWNGFTAVFAPGAFSGDGYADVMARDSLGRLWLYPGNGHGGWLTPSIVGVGWSGLSFVS